MKRPPAIIALLGAALFLLGAAAPARSANDEPPPPASANRPSPAEIPPQAAVQSFHVTLELARTGQPPRKASYSLWLASDSFGLDLGHVRVLGRRSPGGDTLLAWHEHDPTTVFRAAGEPLSALIRANLPPLWNTLLADWLSGDESAYPLVAHDWPEPPGRTVRGDQVILSSGAVEIHRTIDDQRRTVADDITLPARSGATSLHISYEPVPPESLDLWSIDPGARTPVSSISALRPRPAPIQPGQPILNLHVFDPRGDAVDWKRAFDPEPSAHTSRHAGHLLLIFERIRPGHPAQSLTREQHAAEPAEGAAPGSAQGGANAASASASTPAPSPYIDAIADARQQIATAAAARDRTRPLFVVRPVAVFDVPDYSASAFQAAAKRWSALATDPLLAEIERSIPAMLWTQPPRDSIELFAPGAQAAAVLIDDSGRLVSALRLDESDADLDAWLVEQLSDKAKP